MKEQAKGHNPHGLDKYFQVLPLVENFLIETDPQLKKDNGIFFTPYPVVSFIVRSIHAILKEKLGNPPYSGHSSNKNKWISEKIKDYYPPNEKNLKWLQDDYVKFIRFAQEKIDENGEGVIGFITNNVYLDNPTFRRMRQSLMQSFDEIYILNLHGNVMKNEKCPDGTKDENVFNIRQGVAITFL